MSEPMIDGGVIDDAELAALARRTATEVRRIPDLEPALGNQLAAVATVLDALASRLGSPPADLTDLAAALDRGDLDVALGLARQVATAERARLPEPDWDLFA
jgi:hypothetical protein